MLSCVERSERSHCRHNAGGPEKARRVNAGTRVRYGTDRPVHLWLIVRFDYDKRYSADLEVLFGESWGVDAE